MRFVMNLPRKQEIIETQRVFMPGSSPRANSFALKALLDKLTDANSDYLANMNPAALPLYSSGVYYARTTEWDSIPVLYWRGYGDCKSLTCALVAEYRRMGKQADPVFRYVKNKKGSYDFHILVRTARGFEDPSKVLGMGLDENAWFRM